MSQRLSAGKVFAVVVIVILVLAGAAEFATRKIATQSVINEVVASSQETGGALTRDQVHVSFGSVPVIAGLLSGKVSELHISSPSTLYLTPDSIKGQPDMDIHAKGVGVRDDQSIDDVTASFTMPDSVLTRLFQDSIAQQYPPELSFLDEHVTITNIASSADTNTTTVELIHGAVMLTLTPKQEGNTAVFEAKAVSVLGINLPQSAVDSVGAQLRDALKDATTSASLELTSIEVQQGALRVTVHGTHVNPDLIKTSPEA